MKTIIQLLNSEVFWLGLTALVGYAANTIVSRKLVSRLAPSSPIRRAIRALHGFLDRIDPPGVLVLLAIGSLCLPLCSGCVPSKATLPTPREAVILAYNVTDDALAAAIIAVPLESLPKLKPAVDRMPAILDALKTGQNACAQLPELESVVGAFGCDDCSTALKVAREVCQ